MKTLPRARSQIANFLNWTQKNIPENRKKCYITLQYFSTCTCIADRVCVGTLLKTGEISEYLLSCKNTLPPIETKKMKNLKNVGILSFSSSQTPLSSY